MSTRGVRRVLGVAVALVAVIVPGAMLSLRGVGDLVARTSPSSSIESVAPTDTTGWVPVENDSVESDPAESDAVESDPAESDAAEPGTIEPDAVEPGGTAPEDAAPAGTGPAARRERAELLPTGAVGEEKDWELVFADEFGGTELDESSWARCYWWSEEGCTNKSNHEEQWYVPEAVTVADGTLRLTADRQPAIGEDGKRYEYTSGIVSGMGRDGPRRLFRYGYFEMRAKVPQGRGLWPAFWMLPATTESKPEIDIMEVLGHQTDQTLMYFHWRDAEGNVQSTGEWWHGSNMAVGWHTFGLHWEPDQLTWYIDGVPRLRLTDEEVGVPNEDMYLLANLAIGGDFATSPDATTTFPATFEIDYVRVWQ